MLRLRPFNLLLKTNLLEKSWVFLSDGGTEFTNNRLKALFLKSSTHHSMSYPYTPAQNGSAKHKHMHITETGLVMLFHTTITAKYWAEAFSYVVYIINRLLSSILVNRSPFELLFSVYPAYENFHVFGYHVYSCLCDYAANKFSPKSVPCIFLGYSSHQKGFRCMDPASSQVYITLHAQFNEECFPFSSTVTSRAAYKLEYSSFLDQKPTPSSVSTPIFL